MMGRKEELWTMGWNNGIHRALATEALLHNAGVWA